MHMHCFTQQTQEYIYVQFRNIHMKHQAYLVELIDLHPHQEGLGQVSFLPSWLSLYLQLSKLHISVSPQAEKDFHKSINEPVISE